MPFRPAACSLLTLSLVLTGCSLAPTASPNPEPGLALRGSVHGGQQPVNQSHVYLLAASTSGYGSASTSLLSTGDGADSIGTYVLSAPDGSFSITGDYTCTLGQQVYLYALSGDPGAGTNPAAGMMAALGSCPSAATFAGSVPFVIINELSTVALAYAASGFAVDPLHIASASTAQSILGLANAFAAAPSLVGTGSGQANATTSAGNGTIPRSELNTMANILAACINSNGAVSGGASPTPCFTLFENAQQGVVTPTDTAGAAINIAHNPAANVAALYNLEAPASPFAPALSAAPADFTLNLIFTGGGLATSTPQQQGQVNAMNNIAVDAEGNIWKPNYGANSLTELSPLGAPLSGASGFTGGGLNHPANVAIDPLGHVWVGNTAGNSVSKFSAVGAPASGSPFLTGALTAPQDLAVDGSGNVWILNTLTVSKLSYSGTPALGSPFLSNILLSPVALAIQPSGEVWVTNSGSNTVSAYTSSGAAAPGSPFSAGSQSQPFGVAFDSASDGWIANQSSLTALSSAGANLSGSPFTAPDFAVPTALSVDGAGSVFAADVANNTILQLNASGVWSSGSMGFQYGQSAVPEALAVDPSGNVWYSTQNDATIHELVGAAAPVVTPLSLGVKNSKLGTRP